MCVKTRIISEKSKNKSLFEPSFQGVNRLFVLAFEYNDDNEQRISSKRYYIPNVKTKDYNVMTDGKNFFGQPINSSLKIFENVRRIATGQGDDYTPGCLLHYIYFNKYYKTVALDLSKKRVLDADPKAIQKINCTEKNNVTYFDSFRVEHVPKEIIIFINDKNIKTNIFRIQVYDSIMCGYFCIGFIDFMLARKILTEFTNLFSPNNFFKK